MAKALEQVDTCSAFEVSYLAQGFRQKSSKALNEKLH